MQCFCRSIITSNDGSDLTDSFPSGEDCMFSMIVSLITPQDRSSNIGNKHFCDVLSIKEINETLQMRKTWNGVNNVPVMLSSK